MTQLQLVALSIIIAGCARSPRTTAPVPVRAEQPVPADSAATPPTVPDSLASWRVPEFRPLPLVTWGPAPPGVPHAEREREFDLLHQTVHVRFDWERHAVIGTNALRLAALAEPLDSVRLDAVGMSISAVTDADHRTLAHRYDGRTLTIALASRLAPGDSTKLTVAYETIRPSQGVYFIDRRHVIWTQGETEATRHWIPTYDYPNDKATWEIFVRTPSRERALSNGTLVDSRRVGDEIEWHWRLARPASTYLMSVVTGDYIVLQDTWRSVPVGYWVYPDSVQAGWRGFSETPVMMEIFSDATGVDYPWAKYDQSVAPDYIFGGMENVTATTVADDAILHPAWAEPQANTDGLVSHELAHQWYGDLVTTRNWANIWLNEGFATFYEAIYDEMRKGDAEASVTRLAAQEAAIAADITARRPLVYDRWVTDPLELFLSGHIYPKGATVLQMLRRELGDSLFRAGMRAYTADHTFASVVSEDVQRSFEETTGRNLDRFFDQWVYGAGFPVLRISHAYDSLAHTLTLVAQQVQARDSLTGYFHATVDIEVLTDSGRTRAELAVRDSISALRIDLPAAPLSIRWDHGGWLLDVADFPRSTVMLAHQLENDADVLGRIEAAVLLGERGAEAMAVTALAGAAAGDPFWAVRRRATTALGAAATAISGGVADAATTIRPGGIVGRFDTTAQNGLLQASHDDDARVRQEAAVQLGGFGPSHPVAADGAVDGADDAVVARLRELARFDSSLYVRAAALASLVRAAPEVGLVVARAALERDSWLDVERRAAIEALAAAKAPDAWSVAVGYIGADAMRNTRVVAIATLMGSSAGRESEVVALLAPLLDDPDLFIRQAAARSLGALGDPAAVPALEARLRVESESRVINTIEGALAALRSP